ncbi:alkaline phosphatase, tissue-nonspecific isozyme [Drosophila subobscura]|uniref:alkaline phosphatase, tissue-nonspecific isozyme n=1 Tax=Drosophila subobscura TaxID=7241 RepID=UPI00155A32C7|nr:alkaline phosphatase, tissue-nonspecific isozyme [Drosophila subobscura]
MPPKKSGQIRLPLSPLSLLVLLSLPVALCANVPPLSMQGREQTAPKPMGEAAEEELTARYWLRQGRAQVAARLERTQDTVTNGRRAKNIIMMLGDGMSITTLTAARILNGQRQGHSGEESKLAVEDFPYSGLCKTYCTNEQAPDSACTATAYLCGVKTSKGTVGQSASGETVESLSMWAHRAGKATGLVTTTRVTDASPAAAYAHVAKRREELEVARQLVEEQPGRHFKVILGGGLGKFNFERSDGRDLVQQWKSGNPEGCYARSISELRDCVSCNGSILGLFSDSHMGFHLAHQAHKEQPSLSEMTAVAIERLSEPPDGYFLFIEAGRIDHGHHETRAGYALDETLEFDAAIEMALRLTDPKETLIVVTSDHSHTLTMSGYARRGTPILGMDQLQKDLNGVQYSTLNYAIGKWQSHGKDGRRENPGKTLTQTSLTPSYIPGFKGVHSGEDVAVFAIGPQSHLFGGIMEQNLLPHLMGYAADLDSLRNVDTSF